MRYPLVGPPYPTTEFSASAAELTNLYTETIESGADQQKNNAVLVGVPGRHTAHAYSTPIRGLLAAGDKLIGVQGLDMVIWDSSFSETSRFTNCFTLNDGLPAQMFGNGNQLMIVAGDQAYISNGGAPIAIRFQINGFVDVDGTGVDLTWVSGDQFPAAINNVTINVNGQFTTAFYISATALVVAPAITGPQTNVPYSAAAGDLLDAVTGTYLDGYFLVQRVKGGTPDLGRQVNFSALLDGTNWSGLDFFTKEGWPDELEGIITDSEVLYLGGTETIEAWQLNPSGNTIFTRIPGAMTKFGWITPYAAAAGGHVFFVGGPAGGQGSAYRIDGGTCTRISTHAVEQDWVNLGLGLGIIPITYAYFENGHLFWVISFTNVQTWVWDNTRGDWHLRMDWSGTAFVPNPIDTHAFMEVWGTNGRHMVSGSVLSNNLSEQSILFYDQAGSDMAWRRALPYRYNGGKRLYFGRMDLEMDTGTVPSGSAPNVVRDYSDNRGASFVNAQNAGLTGAGTHGQTGVRMFWPQGGSCDGPGRIWRLFGKGQYRVAIADLECEEEPGTV
jgi:hypothetical protein